jgi:glutamate racemase
MKKFKTIVVFDSGLGGLTILKKMLKQPLGFHIVYIADNLFNPYGEKSSEEIQNRVNVLLKRLCENYLVEAIVIACNTATAYAIDSLRQSYQIPIIGMEPAIKPATQSSENYKIGVLATSGTIQSARFTALLDKFSSKAFEFFVIPGKGLVELIEDYVRNKDKIKSLLQDYRAYFLDKGIDTLVLGCTHYPLIYSDIKEIFGESIKLIETSDAVVARLAQQVKPQDQAVDLGIDFFFTSKNDYYEKNIQYFFPENKFTSFDLFN